MDAVCQLADNVVMLTINELIAASVWAERLEPPCQERVLRETLIREVGPAEIVVRAGEPVEFWNGVIDGLVKINKFSSEGKSVTFAGVPRGGWWGEGSLIKRERRRYDVTALRRSKIAYMPRATFEWLLDTSIAFNRFLLTQLNERLGQFIGAIEHERLLDPDGRVARAIAALFNPILYPGAGMQIQISQEEIGYLCGTSRQRVNQALQQLERAGLLKLEYGGVTVLDLDGLRRFEH